MATYKHTPGPWAVGKYTPTDNFKAIPSHTCVCDPKTMALIATTGPADDRQSQIDADLMAAAPDLLAALEEMARIAWSMRVANNNAGCNNAHFHRLAECESLARAAIAKATGVQ